MKKLFDNNLKTTLVICSLIGTLAGGIWAIDGRYARASDVKQQVSEIKNLYLTSELRALKKEAFEFLVAQQKRKLTLLELGRLQQIKEDIKKLEKLIAN